MLDITSFLTPEGTPERCGIITHDDEVLELSNVAAEPSVGFRFDPWDIATQFPFAKATWHTHPGTDPNLSEEDYAGFSQWPELLHGIVGLRKGEATTLWFGTEDGVLVQL